MVERGSGHLLLMASMAGWVPTAGSSLYNATKFAIRGFGHALRAELRGTGVDVLCVCPGFTRTEFQQSAEIDVSRVPSFAWMSADEVAERFCEEVGHGYSFAVVNFANPDMVGHSGVIPAVVAAVEETDRCLGRVVDRVTELGGVCLITADHGNAEQLLEPDGVSPHTAHTTNPVPLVVTTAGELRAGGELADLVPTALGLLGVEPPSGMSGHDLLSTHPTL